MVALVVCILATLVSAQLGYTAAMTRAIADYASFIGVPALSYAPITARPPLQNTTATWERIQLPMSGGQPRSYVVRADDPETIVACSGPPTDAQGLTTVVGAISLWITHDGGRYWAQAPSPPLLGNTCYLSGAADDPAQLAVLTGDGATQPTTCSNYQINLSADGGATWRPSPSVYAPVTGPMRVCWHYLWRTARHLYLYTSYQRATTQGIREPVMFATARSDDGGASWMDLDAISHDPLNGWPEMTAIGDRMLATSGRSTGAEAGRTILWSTVDAGRNWRPLSILDGYHGGTIWTPFGAGAQAPAADHPIYVTSMDSVSSSSFREQVVQLRDADHWSPVPPLPVPNASTERTGVLNVLGETKGGVLLTLGADPATGVILGGPQSEYTDAFKQQWLWGWDPYQQRWTSYAAPLPVAWPACSDHCWQAQFATAANDPGHTTYLYVSTTGADGGLVIYRIQPGV